MLCFLPWRNPNFVESNLVFPGLNLLVLLDQIWRIFGLRYHLRRRQRNNLLWLNCFRLIQIFQKFNPDLFKKTKKNKQIQSHSNTEAPSKAIRTHPLCDPSPLTAVEPKSSRPILPLLAIVAFTTPKNYLYFVSLLFFLLLICFCHFNFVLMF